MTEGNRFGASLRLCGFSAVGRCIGALWLLGCFGAVGLASTPAPAPAPTLSPKTAARVKAIEADVLSRYARGQMSVVRQRQQLLDLHQRAWGKDNPHLAQRHFDLAGALMGQMQYVDALTHYSRASTLFASLHGRKHPMVATSLQMEAILQYMGRDFDQGEKNMRRAMGIRKELYGEKSLLYATYLGVWASVLQSNHSYRRAERLFVTAVSTIELLVGPNDVSLAGPLFQLGWLYYARGDVKRGDKAFERLERIQEAIPRSSRSSMAQTWVTVGRMNQGLGRDRVAKRYFDKAEGTLTSEVAELRRGLPKTRPRLSTALASLGRLYEAQHRHDEALSIFEKLRDTASNPLEKSGHLFAIAGIAMAKRNYATASTLYRQVIAIYRKKLGAVHTVGPRSMLAHVLRASGDYDAAFKLLNTNLKAYQGRLGKRHPFTLLQLEQRASLRVLMGQVKRAVQELTEMHAALEPYTRSILSAGSEADNRQYLSTLAHQLDTTLTIHQVHAPKSVAAARLALQLVVQRKGRLLDAVADVFGAMRRRMTPDTRALLDRLRAAKSRLSKLIVGGPGKRDPKRYQRTLAAAETQVRQLEERVRARSSAYRASSSPVTLSRIASALPRDGVLVEFVAYDRRDLRKQLEPGNARYAAYVMNPKGTVTYVDLGPRKVVDALVVRLRDAMSDPSHDDVQALANQVYVKTFKPLEPLLHGSRRVIISPDAELNLVPFAALVDDNQRFLIQRFLVSYVGSGRDLLRPSSASPRAPVTIIANPVFDRPSAAKPPEDTGSTSPKRGRLAGSLAHARWKRLPGTAAEADAVAAMFHNSVLRTGAEATENAIKKLSAPRILHIATHGFFLPARRVDVGSTSSSSRAWSAPGVGFWFTAPSKEPSMTENPLLRSGLALDGANQLQSGSEDGILTALEATDLDLHGTQLVVLSACETGVGEVRPGDGVHGLRRALVIAGAESLLMTLWQVDDEATKTLMIAYYKALNQGAGRAQALRQVQLKLLRHERFGHPFYWAAFIAAGRWQPLRQ